MLIFVDLKGNVLYLFIYAYIFYILISFMK